MNKAIKKAFIDLKIPKCKGVWKCKNVFIMLTGKIALPINHINLPKYDSKGFLKKKKYEINSFVLGLAIKY
jgi:hypothetical protein